MTDDTTQQVDALKARHRAMWASGDYATLATDIIWPLGPRVVLALERVSPLVSGFSRSRQVSPPPAGDAHTAFAVHGGIRTMRFRVLRDR